MRGLLVLCVPFIIGCIVAAVAYSAKGWWGFWLIFPWIGASISIGQVISARHRKDKRDIGRRIAILAIAPVFLIFIGIMQRENLQLEETIFYLAAGAFSRVLLHYTIAKVAGPLIWGRGFCGWACWTAAILEWLPIKENKPIPLKYTLYRFPALIISILVPLLFIWSGYDYTREQLMESYGKADQLIWFLVGNSLYYILAILLAFIFKKKRAFCKILCPVALVMKIPAKYARIKVKPTENECVACGQCSGNCPMDVDVMGFIRRGETVKSTECILCRNCSTICPVGAVK